MEFVSVVKTESVYPNWDESHFRPSEEYPEVPFEDISRVKNSVYEAVRQSFFLLGLDESNYGTNNWNPLKNYVNPGDTVLIKPNLVMDVNGAKGEGTDCLYTHPSVVAAVIDYVIVALSGTGKIIIGDAPMQECNFDSILENGSYNNLVNYYLNKGIDIKIVDFRELTSVVRKGIHYSRINENAKGKIIDLGDDSEFFGEKQFNHLRVTNYDPRILGKHHNSKKNEYYISEYILEADVIINMPKPKTHRKAGATISLKNFIGANVRKEFLPHHTMGPAYNGGDEYKNKSLIHSIRSFLIDKKNLNEANKRYYLASIDKKIIGFCSLVLHKRNAVLYEEGSWYGNNTISRTISDLNKIIKYANKNGTLCDTPQRKMLIVADMIISGEKEGPVCPTEKKVGIIACGKNPVCFDIAIASLMGFDPSKIPTINVAKSIDGKYKLCKDLDIVFKSNSMKYENHRPSDLKYDDLLHFEPTLGWKGHIERDPAK